jgi:hypothetical protein
MTGKELPCLGIAVPYVLENSLHPPFTRFE